ncbi:rod shape-determining protein MreC [Bacteroidota bacterium]
MRNLLRLLLRYHAFILFLILEAVAISFLVRYNPFQKARFINFTHVIQSKIYNNTYKIKQYFKLKEINQHLLQENNLLLNNLPLAFHHIYKNDSIIETDTIIFERKFSFISAKAINVSTNKQFNYITIDKGKTDGIDKEMGVISAQGVIGVVNRVSNNFATVISILNPSWKVSAKIKKNNYFGSLQWDGNEISTVTLNEIPYHVDVAKGDTIVTSGHSAYFPEGLLIGYVTEFEIKDGNFYEIKVKLSTDMQNLYYVHVINNLKRKEQIILENKNYYD